MSSEKNISCWPLDRVSAREHQKEGKEERLEEDNAQQS